MTILNRRSPYRNWRMDQAWGQNFTVNKASPQYNGLVAWWPLGLGQYGMVRDVMGRWHMTAFNTPNLVRDGQRGVATLFDDGANEHLQVGGAVLAAAPLTMSCRFQADAATARMVLLAIHSTVGPDNDSFSLEARGDAGGDPLRFVVRGGGANTFAATSLGFTTGVWHHACAVEASPTNHAVFLDGGNKGTGVVDRTPANLNQSVIASLNTSTLFFSGLIVDVRIRNRALSDAEVYEEYRNPWDLWLPTRRAFFMVVPALGGQAISPDSIASAETFGSPVLAPGAVTVTPTGIVTAEAFGSHVLQPGPVIVAPSAIITSEAHGTPTIVPGPVTIIPTGILTGESFGSPVIALGLTILSPTGIVSSETFGAPVLVPGAVTILPGGIATAEAFGSPVVSAGAVIVAPSSIVSAEVFGSPSILPGGVVLIPTGIASAEAFGTPWVGEIMGILIKLLILDSMRGGSIVTRRIAPGSIDQSVKIRIVDSSTGLPEQAVDSTTPGLSLWYRRQLGALVAISPSDLSALTDAHVDGGLLHIDDGYYRLDIPDAAFAQNADSVMIAGTATDMLIVGTEVEIGFVLSAGAIEFTYTLTEDPGGDPIANAVIWISTDQPGANIVWRGETDNSGIARSVDNSKPWLTAGTYYVFAQKSGYTFDNPDTEVVV